MTQLELGRASLSDRFHLSCDHDAEGDRAATAKLADGWYAAISCPVCRRKSAVVYVAFGVTSDAVSILTEPDERNRT